MNVPKVNVDKETVKKVGLKAVEKLQFALLFVLSVLLIAGVDLITADVAWEMIKSPSFYISNILVDIALLLITYGTIYIYLDWFKENDPLYLDAKKAITEFARSDRNVPTILSRFLDEYNRRRKIAQYKLNIKIKLHNLENDRRFWSYVPIVRHFLKHQTKYSEEEMHLWNVGTEEEKAKSEYCRKRKMYEEQLNDELIERTIDNEFVAYDVVTTDIILSEYYRHQAYQTANDFVTKDENSKIAVYKIPRLVLSFGFIFLFSGLACSSITVNWAALITIGTKLLSIAWNTFTSYRYAKKHAISITQHDMIFRKSVIVEYDKWLVEQAAKADTAKEVK